MEQALIRIVVPAYKHPEYLRECLIALQAQTFKQYEVFVVDDHSPQDMCLAVEDIIEKDLRFNMSRNSVNLGGPASFMRLSKEGSAKYIMWLHHDDWLHPTFLEKAFDGLEKNLHCTFAYSLCSRVIDGIPRDEFPSSIRPWLETGAHDVSMDTVINCWIMWSSALIRSESLREIGGLESLYQRHEGRAISVYRKGESDLYVFARLSSLGEVYVINERLCYYRDHGGSNTSNLELRSTHIQDNIRTYDYIFDDVDFFSDEVRIVAKINSIGRLSTGESLAITAYRLLYIGKLAREFRYNRKEIVQKLKVVMSRFRRDKQELLGAKFFSNEELSLMDVISQME